MVEELFLCGLSPTQRAKFKGGRELHLHGPKTNLRLKLDALRHRLLAVEPLLLTDLAEIATYVFAADCLISRGGVTFKNVGEKWRRTFRLVVAVRQPGTWKGPLILHALCEALGFLSDDNWGFEFVELESPPDLHEYLNYADPEIEKPDGVTIVPFSGGLDSFAGAVQELNTGERHIVLLSRRIGGMIDGRQRELADELKRRHPNRITHVAVIAGLTAAAKAVEHTQRTRSFVLTALALVAAEIERADRIRFYENGVMSVNLPISTQLVGTRASRSTHPRSLMLLQDLCRLVRKDGVAIENPFIWMTKAEVVTELRRSPEGDAMRLTLSCSRTRELTRMKPHCGTCAQCLQRRISTLGARAEDTDPGEAYGVDLLLGPRQVGPDRAMAVDMVRSALEFTRLSDAGFATRFAGDLAWLTSSFADRTPDEVARRTIAMLRRHGETVRTILTEAAARHAEELIDHTLPSSCLLQLAVSSPELGIAHEPIAIPAPEGVEEAAADGEGARGGGVRLAVDNVAKRILIDGIAPLTAPGEFRLLSELVRLYREDREAERAPESNRTISAEYLAEAAGSTGDVSGRKAISRVRHKIRREYRELYGMELGADAVIENVPRQGYRLNPAVRVVAPAQLGRG